MTLASVGSFVRHNGLSLLMLGVLLGFLGIHAIWYIRPSGIRSMADLDRQIHSGQPTVIEFYSNL